ncbi:hypothetical protein MRX96_010751 [Rhipicephalus microplus]
MTLSLYARTWAADHRLTRPLYAEAPSSTELVEEVTTGSCEFVRVTGVASPDRTVSILVRGSNKLVLEEAAVKETIWQELQISTLTCFIAGPYVYPY